MAAADQLVRQGQRQHAIGPRPDTQPDIGTARKTGAARVHHDQPHAALARLFDLLSHGQPGGRGIDPPQHQAARCGKLGHADIRTECQLRREIAMPVADMRGPYGVRAAERIGQAENPLHAIRHRRAARRGDAECHGLGAILPGDLAHRRGRGVQRLVPADALPAGIGAAFGIAALERGENPVRVLQQVNRRIGLAAQVLARGMGGVGRNRRQLAALHRIDAATAGNAQRTVGRYLGHVRLGGSVVTPPNR